MFRRPIYQPGFSAAARSNSVCIRAVYSSYFRKAQNIVSMIPHTMKKNANCTSSVITTNCFQFGGVAKAVLLLGFFCQRELSLTHAKFLLAILLDGIAEVFFSIGSINERFCGRLSLWHHARCP